MGDDAVLAQRLPVVVEVAPHLHRRELQQRQPRVDDHLEGQPTRRHRGPQPDEHAWHVDARVVRRRAAQHLGLEVARAPQPLDEALVEPQVRLRFELHRPRSAPAARQGHRQEEQGRDVVHDLQAAEGQVERAGARLLPGHVRAPAQLRQIGAQRAGLLAGEDDPLVGEQPQDGRAVEVGGVARPLGQLELVEVLRATDDDGHAVGDDVLDVGQRRLVDEQGHAVPGDREQRIGPREVQQPALPAPHHRRHRRVGGPVALGGRLGLLLGQARAALHRLRPPEQVEEVAGAAQELAGRRRVADREHAGVVEGVPRRVRERLRIGAAEAARVLDDDAQRKGGIVESVGPDVSGAITSPVLLRPAPWAGCRLCHERRQLPHQLRERRVGPRPASLRGHDGSLPPRSWMSRRQNDTGPERKTAPSPSTRGETADWDGVPDADGPGRADARRTWRCRWILAPARSRSSSCAPSWTRPTGWPSRSPTSGPASPLWRRCSRTRRASPTRQTWARPVRIRSTSRVGGASRPRLTSPGSWTHRP